MEQCPFCHREQKQVLYCSDNFYVTPSLGQIVEGYLLICSKKHFVSFSAMPKELFAEFEEIKQKVKKILSENYTCPIFFEHGPIDETKLSGCCINHAHLHAVPVKFDILNDIMEDFKGKEITTPAEIARQFERKIPYFYYENQEGKKYLFEINGPVSSQYFRQIVALKAWSPEKWNWRGYLGLREFAETLAKLNGKF